MIRDKRYPLLYSSKINNPSLTLLVGMSFPGNGFSILEMSIMLELVILKHVICLYFRSYYNREVRAASEVRAGHILRSGPITHPVSEWVGE